MMEELKLLGELVAGLPSLALWVIVMLFIYKVAVIGSIYSVIRFTVSKLAAWAMTRKTSPVTYKEIHPMLDGFTTSGSLEYLIAQVLRCKNRTARNTGSSYIHTGDVDWLREAIDAKIADDEAKKALKIKAG